MLANFKTRFSSILNPQSYQINPIPAAACLFDHIMASIVAVTSSSADNLTFIMTPSIVKLLMQSMACMARAFAPQIPGAVIIISNDLD